MSKIMPYAEKTRKFMETRALSPGEVRVRIMKGDVLLYTKIGHKAGPSVTVEYMGRRYAASRFGPVWQMDISKIEEPQE